MPSIGATIGAKFRLDKLLGTGGMGAVYEATHTLTGKRVALKWLTAPGTSEEAVQRFLREAQAAARVEHPNVVDVYDVGTDGDGQFLVMELLRGEPLRDLLDRGPLPADTLVHMLLPAIRAVGAAHRQQVVHRDLKPDNIFLCYSEDGEFLGPKILDFGISKISDELAPSLTVSGMIMGTPFYMSPEQIRSLSNVDSRTDVYSFGVILYEALTGRVPFGGDSYGAVAIEVATGTISPPSRVRNTIPKELDAIVLKAMARKPDDRYQTADELAAALAGFASTLATRSGMLEAARPRSIQGGREHTGPQPRVVTPIGAPARTPSNLGPPLAPRAASPSADAPSFGPPRVPQLGAVITPQPVGPAPVRADVGPARADRISGSQPPISERSLGAAPQERPEPAMPQAPLASAEAEFRLPSFDAAPAPGARAALPFSPMFARGLGDAPFGLQPASDSPFSPPRHELDRDEPAANENASPRRAERRPVRHTPPPGTGSNRPVMIALGVAAAVVVVAIGIVAFIATSSNDEPPVVAPIPPIVVPPVPVNQATSVEAPPPPPVEEVPPPVEPVAEPEAPSAPSVEHAPRRPPVSAMRDAPPPPPTRPPRQNGLTIMDF